MIKKFLVLLTLVAYTLLCLTGCEKADPIALPQGKEISSIRINLIDGTQILFEDFDGFQKILSVISNGNATRKESVQDIPLAEKYGKISIENGDNTTTVFYYEEGGKHFLEQPYQGIYEIKDNFENLIRDVKSSIAVNFRRGLRNV